MRDERLLDVGGVTICVDVTGPVGAPTLVLAHGASCSLDAWPDAFVALLARERRVVRFDWRDTGRSTTWPPGAPGYGLMDLVADVVAVADAHDARPVHLVGLSMGGMVAQLVALEHPGRVATLTLVSTTPGAPGRECDDLPGPDPDLFEGAPPEPDPSDPEQVVAFLVEQERAWQRGGFEEDVQREVAVRTVARAHDLRSRDNHGVLRDAPVWRERLDGITAPTLVVHGADDPMFPLPHAHALVAQIPHADLLVVPDAGHGVPPSRTWPDLVGRLLAHTA